MKISPRLCELWRMVNAHHGARAMLEMPSTARGAPIGVVENFRSERAQNSQIFDFSGISADNGYADCYGW